MGPCKSFQRQDVESSVIIKDSSYPRRRFSLFFTGSRNLCREIGAYSWEDSVAEVRMSLSSMTELLIVPGKFSGSMSPSRSIMKVVDSCPCTHFADIADVKRRNTVV